MTTLADTAPASTWALAQLRKNPALRHGYGPANSTTGRLALLALAALADEALHSPNGYSGSTASEVGLILGLTARTAQDWLISLAAVDLAVRTPSNAAWRIPEAAFAAPASDAQADRVSRER